MQMELPIDLIPGTDPPKFKWKQIVQTLGGLCTVHNEGVLPPAVESAVKNMIVLVKQLKLENDDLRNKVNGLAERVAAQSELLSKKAESTQPSKKAK